MLISILGYDFEGPYPSSDQLENKSGVYVVVDWRDCRISYLGNSDIVDVDKWPYIIDVGKSRNIKRRLEEYHRRRDCWEQHSGGAYQFAVYYTAEEDERKDIEDSIRQERNPPCGVR